MRRLGPRMAKEKGRWVVKPGASDRVLNGDSSAKERGKAGRRRALGFGWASWAAYPGGLLARNDRAWPLFALGTDRCAWFVSAFWLLTPRSLASGLFWIALSPRLVGVECGGSADSGPNRVVGLRILHRRGLLGFYPTWLRGNGDRGLHGGFAVLVVECAAFAFAGSGSSRPIGRHALCSGRLFGLRTPDRDLSS